MERGPLTHLKCCSSLDALGRERSTREMSCQICSRAVRECGVTASEPHDWDDSYAGPPPPWDIGRPQPALVRLAELGAFRGAVLDAGCGTGEHTILAALRGATRTLGIDVSPRAIETARRKAAERDVDARFQVRDALQLNESTRPLTPSSIVACSTSSMTPLATGTSRLCTPPSVWKATFTSSASAIASPVTGVPAGSPKPSCAPHLAQTGGSLRSPQIASTSMRALTPPPLKPGSRMSSGTRNQEWRP